jgi:hypothetical protein
MTLSMTCLLLLTWPPACAVTRSLTMYLHAQYRTTVQHSSTAHM